MADKKVTALTNLGDALAAADLFHVVDDPTGTPINKKIAAEDVFNNIPSWLALKQTSQSITGDGSTSAAAPCTLAASSTDGQIKTILNVSTSGTNNVTITPANFAQGTTVTLNAPGESVTFIYKSSKYYVLSNNGGAIA
jgi:hypothetical protein